jgi:hypothetical protein
MLDPVRDQKVGEFTSMENETVVGSDFLTAQLQEGDVMAAVDSTGWCGFLGFP